MTDLDEEDSGGAPAAVTDLDEESGGAPAAVTDLDEEESGGAPAAVTDLDEEKNGGAPAVLGIGERFLEFKWSGKKYGKKPPPSLGELDAKPAYYGDT